jgi:hypothetical protein
LAGNSAPVAVAAASPHAATERPIEDADEQHDHEDDGMFPKHYDQGMIHVPVLQGSDPRLWHGDACFGTFGEKQFHLLPPAR